MNSNQKTSKRLSFKSYAWRALMAALITAVLNIIVYWIGDSNGAFPDSIQITTGDPLQISNVVMLSILGPVIGIIIFAAVGSIKVFRIIAIIGFILFIYTPFSVNDPSTKFIVFLEIMHVVAAVVTVWVASIKNPSL